MTLNWQKNALNLHLQLWNRHEPTVYDNLQDNNLRIPVDTPRSNRLLNSSHENPRCCFKSLETVSEEYLLIARIPFQ